MRKFATIAAVVALATSQVSTAAPLTQTTRAGTKHAGASAPESRSDLARKSNTIVYALAGLAAAAGLVIAVSSDGGGHGGTRPTSP
jgi:hypothetical protein